MAITNCHRSSVNYPFHIGLTGSCLGDMPPIRALGGLPTFSSPRLAPVGVTLPTMNCTSVPSSATAPSLSTAGSIAAVMTNLLPISSFEAATSVTGVYVGEGLPPVPKRLADKILSWAFVDMAEMLPEFWVDPKADDGGSKRSQPRRASQVTDIFTWLQCYSGYVSVLATRFPEVVPELLAY